MTMLDPQVVALREQSRRRAMRLLTFVLALSGIFCGFLFFSIINPPPKQYQLGTVATFPIGETMTRSVPRLNVSDTLQNRPDVSEDLLYITRFPDNSWRAVLAWDSVSGCIVTPNLDGSEFSDPCSDRVYDTQGQVINNQRQLRLGILPVTISEDQHVIVTDEFVD